MERTCSNSTAQRIASSHGTRLEETSRFGAACAYHKEAVAGNAFEGFFMARRLGRKRQGEFA
jgi:hypothetical protein